MSGGCPAYRKTPGQAEEMPEIEVYETPELAVLSGIIVDEMEVASPDIFYDADTEEIVSVSPGTDPAPLHQVRDGQVERDIDIDSLMDAYAVKLAIGDDDTHPWNFAVLSDSTVYAFDFGMIYTDENSDIDIARIVPTVAGRAQASLQELDVAVPYAESEQAVAEELLDRAVSLAQGVDLDTVFERVKWRTGIPGRENWEDPQLEARVGYVGQVAAEGFDTDDISYELDRYQKITSVVEAHLSGQE